MAEVWRRDRNETRIQPNTQDSDSSYSSGGDETPKRQKTYLNLRGRFTRAVALETASVVLIILVPLTAHAGVFSAVLSALGTNVIAYDARENDVSPDEVKLLSSRTNPDPNAALGGGDIIVDEGALVSSGAFGEDAYSNGLSSGEISIHVVRPCTENGCETLSHIAEMYGVSVNTILWANNIKDPNLVRPGDELVILPITGVRHVVKAGETFTSIAKKYGAESDEDIDALVEEMKAYNRITEINAGDTVVVPGGVVHTAAPKKTTTSANVTRSSGGGSSASAGGFVHPLPGAVRTQGIHGYNGVDLAGVAAGSAVRAAAAGEVIVSRSSGWNGGYGNYVVVKHPDTGAQTLYAHLNSVSVGVGEYVSAGQTVGGVGNTGRSTGIHLHFEVRGAANPF